MTPIRLLCVLLIAAATLQAEDRPRFDARRAVVPPLIDGSLEDDVWQDDPLVLGDWLSYDPLYGEKMSTRTEVRVAYDDRNIYFAFHCIDPDPSKIRATIARRDNIFNDDWVGLSLDSAGSGQTSYHLMVNPKGIQMDALNTSSSGERWEADFVWDSAGQLTDDGYTVEIKLPLQSIRFKGGDTVSMGILFWRRISRLGVSWAWPSIPPGQWVFNRHANLVFSNLKQPPLLELLPSVTYSVNQTRINTTDWGNAIRKGSAGLTAKYGITSSVTLDATVKPDFSQVESDSFQVQVNQRYPIFYSEKRPFFMEGMGLFNIAGTGGDGNMATAVHTRHIIAPWWGSKVTGTAGHVTFGILGAADQTPENPSGANIDGKSRLFTIGRALYSLGKSNYIGGIFTDTELAGRRNRVVGTDIFQRYAGHHQVSAGFLASNTSQNGAALSNGKSGQAYYSYDRRSVSFSTQVEHYDKDFQMDTAFYNRTGFTSAWSYGQVNYYPAEEHSWLKRVSPFFWDRIGRDRTQKGSERYALPGIRFSFTRQGYLRFDQGVGHEAWAGQTFLNGRRRLMGGVQIKRWLNLNGQLNWGWATYYDPVNPYQGRSGNHNVEVVFQPNERINEDVSFNTVHFDRASTGARVYTVNIVNMKSIYQFNKHLFARFQAQFDSSQKLVLTDLLGSYELIPGTVMQAGYGSLLQRQGMQDGVLTPGVGNYLTTSRSLFFKMSYLRRF